MTPLDPASFWSVTLRSQIGSDASTNVKTLVALVDKLFADWKLLFRAGAELPISVRPYLINGGGLLVGSGIQQIKDYASETGDPTLLADLSHLYKVLRMVKDEFFELITSSDGLDYFGKTKVAKSLAVPQKTKFDRILAKRLAVAGLFVDSLKDDPHFGRTKLAKLVYLADVHMELELGMEYYREAAGPLDPRALYNERIGIESLARKHQLFTPERRGQMIRYLSNSKLQHMVESAPEYLGGRALNVKHISDLFQNLDTDQSEIIATLYACWNDLLIRKRKPANEDIINDFLQWSSKKTRFSKSRLKKALDWMRSNDLVPKGLGKLTQAKVQSAK